MLESIIYTIKDLRNAIAHNNVVFDTRFKSSNIYKTLSKLLENDIKISNILFNSITDYIILIVYILKKLKVNKNEIKKLINDYEKLINDLRVRVPSNVFHQIILTNDKNKLILLKNF